MVGPGRGARPATASAKRPGPTTLRRHGPVCLASQTASPARRHARSELLAVHLRIENLSEARKVEHRGWGSVSSFPDIQIPILKDNFGNRYTSIPFGSATRVEGQVSSASIYPDKSVGAWSSSRSRSPGPSTCDWYCPHPPSGGRASSASRFQRR